jgi:hypothetical protein
MMEMVKGKTKSGIKFQLDERIKDDARFLFYIAKMQNKDVSIEDSSAATMGVLKLIFGSDEGVLQFMDAVASANNGVCDISIMMTELNEMFEALNAKNSSSSPQ